MRRKPCVRNCSRKRGLYNGNVQQNPLCAASCVTKDTIHISPRFSPAFFYRDANSVLLLAHLCTAVLIRSNEYIDPGIEHTPYTIFHVPDAHSVFLRAHLCTAVDSMRRKPCVRNCSRKRAGLYNGNVQQNPLCAESCVTKDIPVSTRFSLAFFYRDVNSVQSMVLNSGI